MERSESRPANPVFVALAGIVGTALFIALLLVLMSTRTYSAWGALLMAPVLVAVTIPLLRRQARLEGDRRLLWLLVAALLLKLLGAVVRYLVAFEVYDGVADSAAYHDEGVELSESFRQGRFETGFDTIRGTNFISVATGVLYTVVGATRLGGFLAYSWIGFIGLLFFYKAFWVAVPEGRPHSYARFVFFLPSLLFWPSSIGKESWMMFTLGVAAYGAARIFSGNTLRGLGVVGAGLFLAAMVRPHVAALMAVAIAGAFLFRRSKDHLRQMAPIVKAVGLVMVAVLALLLVQRAARFVESSPVADRGTGVGQVMQRTSERTSGGDSNFTPSVLDSPARAPLAVLTVLFRPLVMEAHNAQALVAAVEATFLLTFSVWRWRWILAAVRSIRRQPYVAFVLGYTMVFIFAFSTVANFGILTRQRVQVLPLFLVALFVAPKERDDGSDDSQEQADQLVPARR